jgi:hypothetical protein
MEISITEAAKRLNIGRSTLYKKVSSGEVSRNPNGTVDTSELFRVFGSSPKTSSQDVPKTPVDTSRDTDRHPSHETLLATLEAENRQLRERLDESKEREAWQRGQIDKLTDTIKFLEAPRTPAPPTPPTQAERLKGFIDRVLGR